MAVFQLALLEEAKEFLQDIPQQARKKVLYNIWRVAEGEKNSELFKKLENSDIWEFRTLYNGIAYRLFSFWDTEEETLVVATHGIINSAWRWASLAVSLSFVYLFCKAGNKFIFYFLLLLAFFNSR